MSRIRFTMLAGFTIAFSTLGVLLLLEIALRFLPVATGLQAQAVTADQPVAKFAANRTFTWSDEWNFAIVNKGRTNNDGFVNDQDYVSDSRPLLAVIGDSYIEAAMVPFGETLHGILSEQTPAPRKVYSFAASGAPLSQYLIWARYARKAYGADSMVFLIIGNDFDESLAKYRLNQTFHSFVPDENGQLEPVLPNEYHPSWKRQMIRLSVLAQYAFHNLQASQVWDRMKQKTLRRDADKPVYADNTDSATDEKRMADSKEAVDAFLRLLPAYSGLPPTRVAFVVDAPRDSIYRNDSAEESSKSYFAQMRGYFMKEARAQGYETIDMLPAFTRDFQENQERFEFPTDGHWNARGHRIAAEAVSQSDIYRNFIRSR